MTRKFIPTIVVVWFATFALIVANIFGGARAQSPPVDFSQLDPDTIAIVRTMEKIDSSGSDWTETGAMTAGFTLLAGFMTWIMKNGGFAVTWRLHEEDRGLIRDVLSHKDLLVEIKTKVENHGAEIGTLRDFKHDFTNQIAPLMIQISRFEGMLDVMEKKSNKSTPKQGS